MLLFIFYLSPPPSLSLFLILALQNENTSIKLELSELRGDQKNVQNITH